MATNLAAPAFEAHSATPSAVRHLRALLPPALRDSLQSARQLSTSPHRHGADDAPLPTGIAAVDRLLRGGLPRGRLVELTGRASCGRFSTLLSTLATTTRAGDVAALVDLGNGLDAAAARESGLVLERLLWVRPRRLKEALISCELLVQTGFPLIAVDLGLPPVPGGRGREASWLRLARAAAARRAALFVSSPYRVCALAADIALAVDGNRPRWQRGDLDLDVLAGSAAQIRVHRSRRTTADRESRAGMLQLATPAGELLGHTSSGAAGVRELPPNPATARPAAPR